MSWKGTPVPNEGTVEKVYVNTTATIDEVLNTINSLELKEIFEGSDLYAYNVVWGYYDTDEATFFQILIQKNEDKIIIEYKDSKNGGLQNLFTYNVEGSENGWTSNAISPIVPSRTPCNLREIKDGFYIGDQNDKLSSLFSITPFEEVQEEVTLDSWAEDIADAIREKKGIESKEEWVGTSVPNSGTIENVYFNTNLSIEEVVDILKTLELVQNPTAENNKMYIAYSSPDLTKNIIINYSESGIHSSYDIKFVDYTTMNFYSYFSSIDFFYEGETEKQEAGWQINSQKVEINKETSSTAMGYEVGTQNDKLSSLFSITPFEQKEVKQLIPRLNFAQEIRSIEGGNSIPTAVPISGMVDKVYFNFNLDISKIVEVIKNLTYLTVPNIGFVYPIISNAEMTDGLLISRLNVSEYYIIRNANHYIAKITIAPTEPEYEFKIIDNRDDSTFYKNDFSQPIEIGFENMVGQLVTQFPDYVNSNELLKEMISITPIQKVESGSGGVIEVDELPTENIEENAIYKVKTPLRRAYVVNSANDIKGDSLSVGVIIYYVEEVETTPTENIMVSVVGNMFGLYCYRIKDVNEIKVYINIGAGLNWYSIGELFAIQGITGMTYKGKILESEISDSLEDGYYVYAKEDYYKYENSSWVKINKLPSLPPISITLNDSTNGGDSYYLKINCQLGNYFGSGKFSAEYYIYVDNSMKSAQFTMGHENFLGVGLSGISAGEHNIKINLRLTEHNNDEVLIFEESWFEQDVTFTIKS